MTGATDPTAPASGVTRVELSCGSFDVLRAVHFARRFPPHFHETFAIGVVESGVTRIRTRRGEWLAGPGAILAFAPGEVHSAEPVTAAGYTYCMIYPPDECAREAGAVPRRATRPPRFSSPVIMDVPLGRQLRDAHACLASDLSQARAESLVVRTLRHLVAGYGASDFAVDDPMPSSDAELVRRAQDFLHERYAGRVTLSELAERFRLSPFQMIRAFRRVLGVPPLAYLLQFRVNRAQALLRGGSALAEVAYSCGFADQSHLTRAFKRVVGVPPGQYARSVRAGAQPHENR